MQDKSFLSMLGDIRYNEWGQVTGAGAVEVTMKSIYYLNQNCLKLSFKKVKFYTTVNITDVKTHGSAARGEKIDADSFELEARLIELLGQRDWFPPGLTSYVNIQRQFFDGFVGQTFKDADKLVGGYILVFVYVNLMLSKMNFVEQRIGLSIVGIMRLGNRYEDLN